MVGARKDRQQLHGATNKDERLTAEHGNTFLSIDHLINVRHNPSFRPGWFGSVERESCKKLDQEVVVAEVGYVNTVDGEWKISRPTNARPVVIGTHCLMRGRVVALETRVAQRHPTSSRARAPAAE